MPAVAAQADGARRRGLRALLARQELLVVLQQVPLHQAPDGRHAAAGPVTVHP